MPRINNCDARQYVARKTPFKANNSAGLHRDNLYVVYSYGPHWPLLVFDKAAGVWIENSERYQGQTTRRHAQQVRQPGVTHFFPTDELIAIITAGSLANHVAETLTT